MKKFLLTLIILSIVKMADAQKLEIYGAYGLGSAQELVDGLSDVGSSLITGGQLNRETSLKYGPVMIGMNYYVTPRLSVGALYSKTQSRSDVESGNTTVRYTRNSYDVIMARSDYRWTRGFVQLYSGLAAGAAFSRAEPYDKSFKTIKETNFAYQVNALGVRAGRKLGVFGELGFGYNGIVNAGISLRL